MQQYPAQGGGFKYKCPAGLWHYLNSRDVNSYPKRYDCVQGRQTVVDCEGKHEADGPGLEQLRLVRPHKENCQLLLKPEDNDLMKDALRDAILNNDKRSMASIYDDVKSR